MRVFAWTVFIGLAGLNGMASGTYPPGGSPRPPLKADAGKIELGRAVYTGKANLTAGAGDAAAQGTRLKALQAKLPSAARKSVDLPALAGRLSADQLSALEVFLEARFDIKL